MIVHLCAFCADGHKVYRLTFSLQVLSRNGIPWRWGRSCHVLMPRHDKGIYNCGRVGWQCDILRKVNLRLDTSHEFIHLMDKLEYFAMGPIIT